VHVFSTPVVIEEAAEEYDKEYDKDYE